MTEKGELEDKLKQILGGSVQATDLGKKIKNRVNNPAYPIACKTPHVNLIPSLVIK